MSAGHQEWTSQSGQDEWIANEVFPGKERGSFVDVGAHNGKYLSNTYILENVFGWQGICVEPNTKLFAELQITRTCILENCCLLDEIRLVNYLEVEGDVLAQAHSGIVDYLGSASYVLPDQAAATPKQALTLGSLLEKHRFPRVIDYLSIDTEGSEFLILKNFPFEKFRFNAITIEHNNEPLARGLQRALLRKHGYILIKTHQVDDYWVHRNCPGLIRVLYRKHIKALASWYRILAIRLKSQLKIFLCKLGLLR